jgi:hypothetical protein
VLEVSLSDCLEPSSSFSVVQCLVFYFLFLVACGKEFC